MTLEQTIESIKADESKYAKFIEAIQIIAPGAETLGRIFDGTFIVYGKIKLYDYLPAVEVTMLYAETDGEELRMWIRGDQKIHFKL